MATKYVCNGALCTCNQGSKLGTLIVNSQNTIFIQKKLMATEDDTTFDSPFFGTCAANRNNPCSPILTKWQDSTNNVYEESKKALLKTSTLICNTGTGGKINITDPLQTEPKIVIFDNYSPPENTKTKQIVSAVWITSDLKDSIQNASYNEKISLLVKTINYETGDKTTVVVDEKEGKDFNNSKEITLTGTVNENGFAELKEILEIETTNQN